MSHENADQFIGFQIHDLSKRMKHYMGELQMKSGADYLTVSHGWIIGYLYRNRDKEIFQKDLEVKMHLAKSSITAILQAMEKNGFIQRVPVERDARLKKIVLTPEGEAFHKQSQINMLASEQKAMEGLTDEEVEDFLRILKHMRSNFDDPCDREGGKEC